MLTSLHIRDFAIIDEITLELGAGFSVLTGETGAGKSILVDAIELAIGGRADGSMIREGAPRAEVTAIFGDLPGIASAWLSGHELGSDGECLLRRVVERDRPSRAFINGRPVPAQQLRELGELLVDIHGQHEHQSLTRPAAQREWLDAFAGAGAELAEVSRLWHEHHDAAARLDAIRKASDTQNLRAELLRARIQDLEALALTDNEPMRLDEEHARLAHGALLKGGTLESAEGLDGEEDSVVTRQLGRIHHRLRELSEHDAALASSAELIDEALIRCREAASDLRRYSERLELDPGRLAAVETRIGRIQALARRLGVGPEALPHLLETQRSELLGIEGGAESEGMLAAELARLDQEFRMHAAAVSGLRAAAAVTLSTAVTDRIRVLGMPDGRFEIRLVPLDPKDAGPAGCERVEFLFSANSGQSPLALARVASGGELSRVGLALMASTPRAASVPVVIFDEVDAGIGGRTAEVVGALLKEIGRGQQALCVTHLAQVAARADTHYSVEKHRAGTKTQTAVHCLAPETRIAELARMMGGHERGRAAIEHAREMLDRVSA